MEALEGPIDRVASTASSSSRTNSGLGSVLKSRRKSKPNNSSTNSIASTDTPGDGSRSMRSSIDGALDKLKTGGSEEKRSSEESTRRMSKLFKGRRKRRKSAGQDDHSQADSAEEIPPLPDNSLLSLDQVGPSEESLGLHKSVASSLLTEDSDTDS